MAEGPGGSRPRSRDGPGQAKKAASWAALSRSGTAPRDARHRHDDALLPGGGRRRGLDVVAGDVVVAEALEDAAARALPAGLVPCHARRADAELGEAVAARYQGYAIVGQHGAGHHDAAEHAGAGRRGHLDAHARAAVDDGVQRRNPGRQRRAGWRNHQPGDVVVEIDRFNAPRTVPEPAGTKLIPMKLSAITVLVRASWLKLLAEFGWNWIALPIPTLSCVKLRMAQFSMIRNLPLLNTIPLPLPKPMPLMVMPRRLTLSLAPPLMVTPLTPPETSMPASPTPSLMMLMVLLMATAP